LRLIGPEERESCTSLCNYRDPYTVHLTENGVFLPYGWCDMFEAIHNGACVYECYAERMKIHWTDVAKKVLLFRGKDL